MYDAQTVKDGLIGLVGWRQNVDPTGWQLTDLTTSQSGLWFNGVHPMLTFENLVSICPEFDLIDSTPTAVNAAFTAWLKEKTEDGIVKAVEAWYGQKFLNKTANSLLSSSTLFDVTGNVADVELSDGKLVGFEIKPTREKSLSVVVNRIGLQFDTNQNVTVSLFKSGTIAPVETLVVDYQAGGGVQWEAVNWKIRGEGAYWIVYDQKLVAGNAVNGVRDYTYAARGLTEFPSGRFYSATAFNVEATDASALWDLNDSRYTVSTNYGLNLDVDVKCEYSDFIVDQAGLFASLVCLQVGMDLLREIAFNPHSRVNRNEANVTRSQLLYEIDGDSQGRNDFSVLGRYHKALGSVQFDTTGINKICLPCRRQSIRHKAIGPNLSERYWPY